MFSERLATQGNCAQTKRHVRTMEEQKVNTKVKDLTPTSKQVNLLAKVVALGEQKEITPRYGSPRRLVEATIGDETGTVILTLWEDQINQVAKDDVVQIDNGFVSLVRGHVRLNVGKYGTLAKPIPGPSGRRTLVLFETNVRRRSPEWPWRERFYRRRGGPRPRWGRRSNRSSRGRSSYGFSGVISATSPFQYARAFDSL